MLIVSINCISTENQYNQSKMFLIKWFISLVLFWFKKEKNGRMGKKPLLTCHCNNFRLIGHILQVLSEIKLLIVIHRFETLWTFFVSIKPWPSKSKKEKKRRQKIYTSHKPHTTRIGSSVCNIILTECKNFLNFDLGWTMNWNIEIERTRRFYQKK